MDYKLESQALKQKLHTEVRNLINSGYSYNEIAKKLNTTPQHISYINKVLKRKGGES